MDLHNTVRVRRGRQDPRGGDQHLTVGKMPKECRTAMWVELGQHVVQNQYRWPGGHLCDEAVHCESQRERERALLSL
jgi:hypothetical protein